MIFPFFTTWTQEIESKRGWVRKVMDRLIRRRLISAEDIRAALVTTPAGLREIACGLMLAASKAEIEGLGHYAPIWPMRFIACPTSEQAEAYRDFLMGINWRPPGANTDLDGRRKPETGQVRWDEDLERANVSVRGSEMAYILRHYTTR